jgi:hypothetical protein
MGNKMLGIFGKEITGGEEERKLRDERCRNLQG